nr:hypothetical protein [Pseudomonas cichorii]
MPFTLGFVRNVSALDDAALKTGSECSFTAVKSGATPTVPRLFLPCLTFARKHFVQSLAEGAATAMQQKILIILFLQKKLFVGYRFCINRDTNSAMDKVILNIHISIGTGKSACFIAR